MSPNPYLVVLRGVRGGGSGLCVVGRVLPLARHGHAAAAGRGTGRGRGRGSRGGGRGGGGAGRAKKEKDPNAPGLITNTYLFCCLTVSFDKAKQPQTMAVLVQKASEGAGRN